MLAVACGYLCFLTSADGVAVLMDPQQQFTMVLAETQQNLAVAEKHHRQAMKKTKKAWSKLLAAKASLLATAIKRYGDDLTVAANGWKQTTASTKLALEKSASNSSGVDWAGIEKRAGLGAKVAAADSEIRRLARKKQSALHEAVRNAEEPLENSAGALTRKLGDLSAVLDKANTVLDDAGQAAGASAEVPAHNESSSASKARTDLAALEHALVASKTKAKAGVVAAEKEFVTTLKGVTTNVTAETAKLKRELEESEKWEMQKVRSKPVQAATKVAKHFRGHAK